MNQPHNLLTRVTIVYIVLVCFTQENNEIRIKKKGLVPDDTVHMVTSKRYKTEKHPTCGTHFSIKFWNIYFNNPSIPIPLSIMY